MQPSQPSAPARGRAPGSFSPLPSSATGSPVKNHQHHHSQPQQQSSAPLSSSRRAAPPPLHIESPSPIDEAPNSAVATPTFSVTKVRQQRAGSPATPIYNQFTTHSNASASSLQHHNFSRPTGSPRAVTHGSSSPLAKNETRKHTATQGMFEPTLPSTATSNLSQVGAHSSNSSTASHNTGLTASQIAAQAAVMSHKNHLHTRQRSQTVPFPGESNEGPRRGSGSRGPPNGPPNLGTAETMPSAYGHSNHLQADRSGNANSFAATTAANVVFPRSGHNSPREPSTSPLPPPPPIPASVMEKPPMSKSEKAKAKLFSRPVKIGASKEAKDKGLPSPGKIGSALSVLQRGNFSTSSLVDSSNQSLYSLSNSSSTTIRPMESTEDKGKEKKHHFLSRQKQKLKDDYHLPLSSAASNSRPTDPNAPSSLYNFNLSSLSGTGSGFSKSKKDKKYGGERSDSRLDNSSTFNLVDFPALSQQSTASDFGDSSVGLGLSTPTSLDEAWPYLKKVLLIVFEGEDLRMPIEDINRLVQMHIQLCIYKRAPNAILDDIREFLATGFASLDRTLRSTSEDRFLPTLVELWLFTFTSILPYLQSVFLPFDLEVAGRGTLMTADQARDFWGGLVTSTSGNNAPAQITPVSNYLDVRQLVLNAYRDIVILPRYDTLKTIFSRLSLEFLPSSFGNTTLTSPPHEALMSTSPPEYFPPMAPRPGTAMSLDPSVASYNSSSGTYFDGSAGGRSRAVSNVSFNSHGSDGHRPFTPSALSSVREQNVESSKQVTDMAGRMLQCMSVLAGLGSVGSSDDDTNNKKMAELCNMLKLNWLGRGRTGRNRRGIVGGRVKREETREEVRVA